MKNTWAVCKCEFASFFTTPIGYVVVGVFALISGLAFVLSLLTYTKMSIDPAAYGYTSFPDTRYGTESTYRAFAIEDNALGYLHGENNLAVMLTYKNAWSQGLRLSSQLEFLLAGSNSPANPWQDATASLEVGTHWIDDPVLQQSVVWTTDLRWNLGDWQFYLLGKLGGVWHALTLQDATAPTGGWPTSTSNLDRYSQIYKPSEETRLVVAASIGFTYRWNISSTLGWLRPMVP